MNAMSQMARPQFEVQIGPGHSKGKVTYNGDVVRNVRRIEVNTSVGVDDVMVSTITLELVGEIIPVRPATD